MKFKKILLSCLVVMGCLSVSAQEPEPRTEYEFHHHWYLQIQPAGIQYTLGEADYDHLLSYNFQVGAGYQINHIVGLRLSVNAFQSRGGSDDIGTWKWNYVAPMADLTANITDAFFGFNPKRVFNFSVFAGIGLNIAWHNNDAIGKAGSVGDAYRFQYLWDDTHARMAGRAGVMLDFRLCDAVSLGLEGQATTLSDHYNSKKGCGRNSDWYFNALLGVKVNIGKTYTKKEILPPAPQERIVERVVEKVVEKPVEQPAPPAPEKKVEPMRRDVFFTINHVDIVSPENKAKIMDIANYMKENPESKVEITGYADKGTGTAAGNMRLSEKRAQAVANILINEHGIDASRITTSYKGDTEQPFTDAVMNRVSICIAK